MVVTSNKVKIPTKHIRSTSEILEEEKIRLNYLIKTAPKNTLTKSYQLREKAILKCADRIRSLEDRLK